MSYRLYLNLNPQIATLYLTVVKIYIYSYMEGSFYFHTPFCHKSDGNSMYLILYLISILIVNNNQGFSYIWTQPLTDLGY